MSMRELLKLVSDYPTAKILRRHLEDGGPVVIVGPDREVNLKAQRVLAEELDPRLRLCLCQRGDDPIIYPKQVFQTMVSVRLTPAVKQSEILKNFLRMRADGMILSSVESDARRDFVQAVLTGSTGGTQAVFDGRSSEEFLEYMLATGGSHLAGDGAIPPDMVLQAFSGFLFLEFAPVSNATPLRGMRRLKPGRVPSGFDTLTYRREPEFELGRDPSRDEDFIANVYVSAAPAAAAPAATGGAAAAEPARPTSAPAPEARVPASAAPKTTPPEAAQAREKEEHLARIRRTAYLPVFERLTPKDLAALKKMRASSGWPAAPGTERKMLLLLQILVADLPAELKSPFPADGVIQVFYDVGGLASEEWFDPFGPVCRVHILKKKEFAAYFRGAPFKSLAREEFLLTRLDPAPDDFPMAESLGESAEDPPLPTRIETKFHGWPHWLQSAEDQPTCPLCGDEMTFFLQIDNTREFKDVTAPDFEDYLFFCRQHLDVWAFVHQTS